MTNKNETPAPLQKSIMRLRKTQIVGIVVGLLFIASLSLYRVENWEFGSGDTAFLTQLTNNIATRGKPVSQISASLDEMFSLVFTTPTEVLCNAPLKIQTPREISILKWHFYAILYLIAPLTWLLGAKVTLSVLTALSFAIIPIGSYFYLRKAQIGHFTCVAVTLLIIAHPAWSLSVQGQLYADRLFVGIGFVLFLLLESPEKNRLPILALMVVGSTVSERFGLVIGGCTIMYLVLCWKPLRPNLAIYLTSVLLAAASFVTLKFFITHPSNASFASSMTLNGFLINFRQYPNFQTNLWCFALITGVFMLAAIGNWRLLAVALFAALPNFIGNIGGAEKTGFLTHYHSAYFPILAAAVVTSVATERKSLLLGLAHGLHLVVFLMVGITAPTFSFHNIAMSGPVIFWRDVQSMTSGAKTVAKKLNRDIAAVVPRGSNIVTLEALMPKLYPLAGNLQMYPLGIDDAQLIILPWTKATPESPFEYPASYSFLGLEEQKKQNKLFAERLKRLGFNLDTPKIVGGWAVMTKEK